MDSFSYLSVLLSIIIGLAVTQVLQGLRALILTRETARIYLPAIMWAFLMLLIATQMWWSSFDLSDHDDWTFGLYGLILLQIGLFYLACGLVLPDLKPGEIDLETDYFRNKGWFFSHNRDYQRPQGRGAGRRTAEGRQSNISSDIDWVLRRRNFNREQAVSRAACTGLTQFVRRLYRVAFCTIVRRRALMRY